MEFHSLSSNGIKGSEIGENKNDDFAAETKTFEK